MSNMLTVKPGVKVMILTSDLKEDPNVYLVDDIKRSVAFLTLVETGRQSKVHRTRIRKIIDKENDMIDNENAVINETTAATVNDTETTAATVNDTETVVVDESPDIQATPKPKRTRAPKAEPVTVDFTQTPFVGQEIWTKGSCDFDFDAISVAAHCIILDNGYQTFNTYNGTLGKKGKMPEDGSLPGVFYNFTEKMTSDKKRETLGKKGYTQRS